MAQFSKKIVVGYIRDTVLGYEADKAANAARVDALANDVQVD